MKVVKCSTDATTFQRISFQINFTNFCYHIYQTHLLSNPLCYDMIGYDDDAWTCHKPKGVKAKKWVVETPLFWIVFQGKEG